VFGSTTHVLWAEEVAREEGVPVDVVPAPEGMSDVCGTALRTLPGWAEPLETLLLREGISFQRLA